MDVLEEVNRSPDDERKEVWIKLREWKDACLADMIELYGMLASRPRSESCRGIKMRTKGGPSFGCSTVLVAGSLSGLPLVGASSASAPGSPTYQNYAYGVGAATFILLVLGLIGFGLKCYRKRERKDGVLGALDVLIRPFRERLGGMYMSVDSLEVGEAKVSGLIFNTRV